MAGSHEISRCAELFYALPVAGNAAHVYSTSFHLCATPSLVRRRIAYNLTYILLDDVNPSIRNLLLGMDGGADFSASANSHMSAQCLLGRSLELLHTIRQVRQSVREVAEVGGMKRLPRSGSAVNDEIGIHAAVGIDGARYHHARCRDLTELRDRLRGAVGLGWSCWFSRFDH
jgi:hypothetical protein